MATLGNVYFHLCIMLMMTGIKYYETFYWTEAESDRIGG